MSLKDDSLYVEVATMSSESSDQVVPNNETWEINHFCGNAAYLDDAYSALVWDYGGAGEEILIATHGDIDTGGLSFQVTGDGSKKLSIVLVNDTAAGRVLGAHWEGRKL
jgi:hypothetical protein